jgi:hypothetical protein
MGLSYISVIIFNFVYIIINVAAFRIESDVVVKFSHFVSFTAAICVLVGFALPNYQSLGWLLFPYLGCYICEAILAITCAIFLRCNEKRSTLPPPYDPELPPYNAP